MTCTNPIATPMDLNNTSKLRKDTATVDRNNLYTQLLGKLQYLANAMQPDITYMVHKLSLYTANPTLEHYSALKQILRYLKGTTIYDIIYKRQTYTQTPLIGYADSGFANTEEKKSMTGTYFLSAGGAVTWRLKKQSLSTLSTTEAEYIALSHVGADMRWLTNLYDKLWMTLKAPLPIYSDSLGTIAMIKQPYQNQKTRHIDLK